MGKLLPVTEATLTAKAAEAHFLATDNHMTVKAACKQVGITERQYYYWLGHAKEAIEKIRDGVQNVYQEEMGRIVAARAAITGKLIEDGLSNFTPPADRVVILQYLDAKLDTLMERTAPTDNTGLNDLMGMPSLKPGTSRFANRGLEIEDTGDGGVTIRPKLPEVIDGSFVDAPSLSSQEPPG